MFHHIADRRTHISEPVCTRASSDVATHPAVLADTLTLVETTQLVQTVLREAFPATSFVVSAALKEHSTQLTIGWTDGPRDRQVARLVMPMQATRLADGGRVERVEHFMLASTGWQTVRLAADRIALRRQFSDRAVEQALARLALRYADYLAPDVRATMTVAEYRSGHLQLLEVIGVHRTGSYRSGSNVHVDVETMLAEMTNTHGFPRSATASRLFVRRDVH
ncbi:MULTISPECIES: LPD29 domain-containing protein [unclassified Burkholderia]|uniref:LPD29 domain-containing protein n=1 Tax=unclassified Burkholderia TaxID=2613784 RepID=UPI00075EB652|nr:MULTISPECIES: LPD29 domain-containing protein [unclassified Burkholderia]KVN20733.1 hypothetical protein WT08_28530 [Burkholderia sp. MSMB1552]KWZ47015.1 hypothetical protein WS92_30230 [Burkholderia sp. MSMB1588]